MHLGNKNPCIKYDLSGRELESILEEKDLGILTLRQMLSGDPAINFL